MKEVEIVITDNIFEFGGNKYDCDFAVKQDKKRILQEAEASHKEELEKLYDKESLNPYKVKLFVDDNDKPIYMMICYIIKYKNPDYGVLGNGRIACGNYHPLHDCWLDEKENFMVFPHPYQGSICW